MHKTLLISLALLTVKITVGQNPDSSSALDPVVVTAMKYPVKLSETGKMLTVISREQIEQSQGKSLAQVLTEQTGTIVSGAYSNPGKDKSIYLRGASNEYTLVLLDGVPVNDPSGPGGAFDPRLCPIEQIDHIEILKGSQSTLYGSDAIAGVINIITKKGGNKKVGINGGLNYGSYSSVNGNAGVNGSLRNLDYNLNYAHSSTDGISEARDTTGKAGFDNDALRRNSFQANLSYKAGKHLRISPYYRYTYYRGGFDADAFTDDNSMFDALVNNTGATANITLPKTSITASYGYTYAKRAYETAFGASAYRGGFQTGDVYATRELRANLKLLVGFNYQSYQLRDSTLDVKNPKSTIVSPYVSLYAQPVSGLNFEAGGRYNYHSEFKSNVTYSFNASYQLAKEVKLFGNVSTGFKAPGVTDLFGPAMYGSNRDLKPEESFSLEGGLRLNTADKKMQLNASVYYRDITNLISYVGNKLINVDQQKDHGVELEASYRPDERWNFKASYNYVTGKLYQSRQQKDTSFFNLIRRPKHSVSVNVGFQATSHLFLNVSGQHIGRRTDLFFAPPTFASTQVNLGAYTLINFYAEYKLLKSRFTLFIDARNLTNVDFSEIYGYNTMGINATGGFRFRF